MEKVCRNLIFCVPVLFTFCKDYSTPELLSLKFPTGGTKGIRISSPSPITVDQPFTVTVTATNTTIRSGAIFSNGTTATVNHNQFVSHTGTNGNNLFYGAAGTLNFTSNYWGGTTSGQTAMGFCDGSNTGGSCATSSGSIDASGAVATTWPLCKTTPSDPNCVGANFWLMALQLRARWADRGVGIALKD